MNSETSPERSPDSQQLQELRDTHVGRLLLQAHRAFAKRSIAKLRQRGHDRLTLAHTALLPHLDLEGTTVTVLAERAGMTKQSMRQLVLDLEEKGYVARAADPNDGRATRVTFTEEGWRFLRDAHEIKKEMHTEYQAILGQERMQDLEESLSALIAKSGMETDEATASTPL